jgi:alkylhydroperoxidase family enzyme
MSMSVCVPSSPKKEIVDLTYAIAMINTWNRLAIAVRAVPGTYDPAQRSAAVLR